MRRTTRLIAMAGLLIGEWLFATVASRGDEINVGDPAPEFECLDDQGQVWNSRDHLGKQIVVVYFYPSDFSFCCTRQACRYRDQMREFRKLDVKVVGISGDAVEAHRRFQATHKLNFSLLADEDGEVARKFGVPWRVGGKAMILNAQGQAVLNAAGQAMQVPRKVTAARWTFVVGPDGRVLYRETNISPVKDSLDVLEFLRTLDSR